MNWIIEDKCFDKDRIICNGNKFLTGNGYMGFRGTMEEFTKSEFTCCNLAGVYDRYDGKWRETVNVPNGMFTTLICEGKELSLLTAEPAEHTQKLDLEHGLHLRKTLWHTSYGDISVTAERFVSLDNIHLTCMKYSVRFEKACKVVIKTGIDSRVWDINGPHFESCDIGTECQSIYAHTITNELKISVEVFERLLFDFNANETIVSSDDGIFREIEINALPNIEYTIYKYVSVYNSNDGVDDIVAAASHDVSQAAKFGYSTCFAAHAKRWKERWNISNIKIEGDEEADIALRYSIYHLQIIAPHHTDQTSIAARGLSGQTYKGAVFWDTEMFLLPFYLYTDPQTARNLIKYRMKTLEGARRKAHEYGFRGAFYAWESQETGDDACSNYNVADVFTGRPMRTYFKDKQIHISADIAYAIWETYEFLGDDSIIVDGGAEVILECARFFYSYVYYKEDKKRYEILDVIGTDEYHERVNNNAFTNKMVYHTFDIALKCAKFLECNYKNEYEKLMDKIDFKDDLENISRVKKNLYIPQPDETTGIIEQFDGYFKHEDCTLEQARERILDVKEYWGGANGIAANTKIIKQADVMLMLYLFGNEYSKTVKQKNWLYYEPKTEHGSSLSPCIYALVACETGNSQWGYDYFMKTANIDLTGESKQFAGSIYIGGTHPAASGGAWMVAVFGFAGLHIVNGEVTVSPKLPKKWERLSFSFIYKGEEYMVDITKTEGRVWKI
jgi:trehalose/maltose hydrolase-like predicted phosphorylase